MSDMEIESNPLRERYLRDEMAAALRKAARLAEELRELQLARQLRALAEQHSPAPQWQAPPA